MFEMEEVEKPHHGKTSRGRLPKFRSKKGISFTAVLEADARVQDRI